MTEKIYKRVGSFKNINKIDKPLARLTKENKEPTQQILKERKYYNWYHENIRIIRSYCEITLIITLPSQMGSAFIQLTQSVRMKLSSKLYRNSLD